MENQEFIRPAEAAKIVKLSPSTLAKMRVNGTGPKYTKAGPKVVLYLQADLQEWLFNRRRSSTSEVVEVAK